MSGVYLLRAANGAVKIGATLGSAEKRLDACRTGSPLPLELVREIPCARPFAAERFLHWALANYHSHGEWFMLPSPVLDGLLQMEPEQLDALTTRIDFTGLSARKVLRGRCPAPISATSEIAVEGGLTIAEVAEMLRLSVRVTERLSGLPITRINGTAYVMREELDQWLKSCSTNC